MAGCDTWHCLPISCAVYSVVCYNLLTLYLRFGFLLPVRMMVLHVRSLVLWQFDAFSKH